MSATPSYFPPGWDLERVKSATPADLDSLPPDDKEKMFDGLRAELGIDGLGPIVRKIFSRTTPAEPKPKITEAPDFAKTMRKPAYAEESWGYVVFKAADTEKDVWDRFLEKWHAILNQQMDFYKDVPDFEDVQKRFQCIFVQDEKSVEEREPSQIARRYRAMEGVPILLKHPFCLAVTPASLESVLNCEVPDPSEEVPWSERKTMPFVQVIHEDYDGTADEHDFVGLTNTAVESLIEPLFNILARQIMEYRRVFRDAGPNDLFLHPFRDGIRRGVVP